MGVKALFYFIRKIKGNYYLYKVEYDKTTGRKRQKLIGNCRALEELTDKILKSRGRNDLRSSSEFRARRLARLGRRPDAAEVRGSNPRGPTINSWFSECFH